MKKLLFIFIFCLIPYTISPSSFLEHVSSLDEEDIKNAKLLNHLIIQEYITSLNDPFLKAALYIESCNGKYMYNDIGAVGWLQQLDGHIEDINRIIQKRPFNVMQYKKFEKKDRLNLEKSIKMWYIWQEYYNKDYNFEYGARIWYGGFKYTYAEETTNYWNKIKAQIWLQIKS
jgi:hypothetical protein